MSLADERQTTDMSCRYYAMNSFPGVAHFHGTERFIRVNITVEDQWKMRNDSTRKIFENLAASRIASPCRFSSIPRLTPSPTTVDRLLCLQAIVRTLLLLHCSELLLNLEQHYERQ